MADNTRNYRLLFEILRSKSGISEIWLKELEMLDSYLKYNDSALQLLCLYFSLVDDGNTCMPLGIESLEERYCRKFESLIAQNEDKESEIEQNDIDEDDEVSEVIESPDAFFVVSDTLAQTWSFTDEFKKTIKEGTEELEQKNEAKNPFVIKTIDQEKWLFAKKFFNAKQIIEERINVLFPSSNPRNCNWPATDLKVLDYTENDQNQKTAVEKGMISNLIISGGPGTGKTTVAYDIIKNILIKINSINELDKWNLYLTAPTGKAKDRLKESILKCVENENLLPDNSPVLQKLREVDSYTIHRLLQYSPSENKFKYKKFLDKSIFVIDEASMIDICLFAALLKAIPDKAIVFILGDENQLPSVDAGAVLGDVLGQKKKDENHTVILDICHRTSSKMIWEAAKRINNNDPDGFLTVLENNKNQIELLDEDKINKEISNLIDDISFKVKTQSASKFSIDEIGIPNEVFSLTDDFKILCAERKGPHGVETINSTIIEMIKNQIIDKADKKDRTITDEVEFFPGEVLMITKNLKMLDLSNGDNGVVVRFSEDKDSSIDSLWFMIKKGNKDEGTVREGIFTKNNYTFYPLYLIPPDSIEESYAMTIHKSQGSGYNKVLVLLPEKKNHPLVNRQILYTAITRAKLKATIISTKNVIIEAIKNKEKRDTIIRL